MKRPLSPAVRAAVALATLAVAGIVVAACQKRQEPVPTLTQDQWRRVQENLLPTAPDVVEHPVDAVFGDMVRLIGWDIDPDRTEAGQTVEITYYWEVLQPTTDRWHIFVHLDRGGTRQNVDHEAMGDIYPSVYWQPGQIIRDTTRFELVPGLGGGDVAVYVGLFRGDDRMPVTRAGQGTLEEDGRLRVGSFPSSWTAPSYQVRRATGTITIDGNLDEPAWGRARQTSDWVSPNDGTAVAPGTWAKMLWDDDYLYVAIHATDRDIWSTITERDGDLWDEEVVEVYLDPGSDGRDYLEFQLNPLNTVFDAVFPRPNNRNLPVARAIDIAGLETAVAIDGTLTDRTDTDTAWTSEIRFPFAALPTMDGPPSNGDTMAVNFYRYDRSGDDGTRYYAWSPVGGGTFHNPERFGSVTFQGGAVRRARVTEGSGAVAVPAADGSGPPRTGLRRRPGVVAVEGSGPN
jgi:hypothetical protein